MFIIEDNVGPTYVAGNLVWLTIEVPKHEPWLASRYRGFLTHKWLATAEYLLQNRLEVRLSWPSIIEYEQGGKRIIELKSEVCASSQSSTSTP